MKFEDILTDLKNKIYKPVYLLHGEEEYYIDILSDYIADNVLDEQLPACHCERSSDDQGH
jgi:DNA polymerase-3 subunit delta